MYVALVIGMNLSTHVMLYALESWIAPKQQLSSLHACKTIKTLCFQPTACKYSTMHSYYYHLTAYTRTSAQCILGTEARKKELKLPLFYPRHTVVQPCPFLWELCYVPVKHLAILTAICLTPHHSHKISIIIIYCSSFMSDKMLRLYLQSEVKFVGYHRQACTCW